MAQVERQKIGVFSFGRKQSQRCPEKMTRPFGDTTLTDIMLEKLSLLGENTFFAGYEEEFADKCRAHGVPFVQRRRESVMIDGPITEILSFLQDLPYAYFLIINGCLPFLKVKTVRDFLAQCCDRNWESAFGVVKRHNFYFDRERAPLNFPLSLKTINTKAVDPVYEFAHALYFFSKDYFFQHGRYWDWREVELVELNDKLELFDIDTEEDFMIAQNMWRAYARHIFSL